MGDLSVRFCGIELDNPFVLGSGPVGFNADGLIEAARHGAGAVVTKSIAAAPFVNTTRHMALNGANSLLNNEGGSDLPLEQWMKEIPKAKKGGVKVLIASVYGYGRLEDAVYVARQCEQAGADMLELVSDYLDPGELALFVGTVKKEVRIPVIVKVNANWKDTGSIALACDSAGADGITAIDSIGPVYRLDLATAQPILGGSGYGWMTGAPILPVSLRYVHDIAMNSDKDIIGLGGVMRAEDALEMLLAGATCCGLCTLPILKGPEVFSSMKKGLSALLDKYGYNSVREASRKSLKTQGLPGKNMARFTFDASKCSGCARCVTVCPYNARVFSGGENAVDASLCRICGLCFTACPRQAIAIIEQP